jgi:hypothetical protein
MAAAIVAVLFYPRKRLRRSVRAAILNQRRKMLRR